MEGDYHLVLLAQNLAGYKNICHLITKGRFQHSRGAPRISMETLAQHSDGVVALSGCPQGIVPALLAAGKSDQAVAEARRLVDLFGVVADRCQFRLETLRPVRRIAASRRAWTETAT